MKKIILATSFFLCLIFFSIFFFFSFSPDNLIDFIPKNADFYLHLNLNQFSYEGAKGLVWLNKFWPEEILNQLKEREDNLSLLGLNLNKNILSFVDEIGLIVRDKNIALLFKTKQKNENLPFIFKKGGNRFFLQRPYPRLIVLSTLKDFFEGEAVLNLPDPSSRSLASLRGTEKYSFGNKPSKGFIDFYFKPKDFEFIHPVRKLQSISDFNNQLFQESPSWLSNGIHLVASSKKNKLIFRSEIKDFSQIKIFSWQEALTLFNFLKEDFVLILPEKEPIEKILFKIKESLAWFNPQEKESVLPDGIKFKELIIDPDYFDFQEKKLNNTSIYSLEEKKINLSKINDHLFFSNSFSSLEKSISNFPYFVASAPQHLWPEADSSFWWRANLGNLEEIFIQEKNSQQLEGYANFFSY